MTMSEEKLELDRLFTELEDSFNDADYLTKQLNSFLDFIEGHIKNEI